VSNIPQRWRNIFWPCFGLFIAAAFCMKWMEGDFIFNGKVFTIIGLEITYSKAEVMAILSGIDEKVKTILGYHLAFDFVFMLGVYPGIACLCMMARAKTGKVWLKKLLLLLAILQLVAWACDIAENIYLLSWIKEPVINSFFAFFHLLVYVKWILALTGAFLAIPLVLKKR
jgi:hypothetical protein